MTTTTDFALLPIAAVLDYAPDFFEETLVFGDIVTHSMTISNLGTVPFDFSLVDVETGNPLEPTSLAPSITCPPDSFGYTCTDSTEPDGLVAYNFEDISGTGTVVTLSDDQVSGAIPIGFDFTYYGMDYTSAYISSNGFLTMLPGQSNGCCTGQPIPTPGSPDGMIAGWWEDLNPGAGGAIHYQTMGVAPFRYFIIQFTDVPHFGGGNNVTMQYKLFEGSNNVEVHYMNAPSDGGTHSAGIENEFGTVGLQYYLGTDGLGPNLAVCYLYPGQFACGSGGEDAPWLDEVPDSGTVGPGGMMDVSIVFDSTAVTESGTYTASILFSGTFDNMVMPATAVMHVLNYSMDMSGDMASSGNPGETVDYQVTITNTGGISDTYQLAVSGHSWTTTLSTNSISLDVGESDTFMVSVMIPAGAFGGDEDTATVTATSVNDPGTSDTMQVTTSVDTSYGVSLAGDTSGDGTPGTTVMYTLEVMNDGNVTDTFNLTLSGNAWTTSLSMSSVMLAPGESILVNVSVLVPAGVTEGDMDTVTVTATSAGDPGTSDSQNITTTATAHLMYLPIILRQP